MTEEVKAKTPFTWVTQYSYNIQGGVTRLSFGEEDAVFAAVALPTSLLIDLLGKLGASVATQFTVEEIKVEKPDAPSHH